MTGFFNSRALKELAPGLSEFLKNSEGKFRLLASPYLSADDQKAILEGTENTQTLLAKKLEQLYGIVQIDTNALVIHTLKCLAYLIACDCIEIKLVLVRDGLFHPKVRIFSDNDDSIVVHGSNNLTRPGLLYNVEQITILKSWSTDCETQEIISKLMSEFANIWTGTNNNYMITLNLPDAIKKNIVRDYHPNTIPSPDDFINAWHTEYPTKSTSDFKGFITIQSKPEFEIPKSLEYNRGDFVHQGQAVSAWEEASRVGILEMATGSGKTVASLIAAKRLFDESKPILIVIAVPYLPLVSQWAKEAIKFRLQPIIPGNEATRDEKLSKIRHSLRNLRLGISDVECIIMTHDFLCDSGVGSEINSFNGNTLIIGDEVHNLGATNSIAAVKNMQFKHRLGLSATPLRQYDPIGSEELIKYFGDVVYQFTLKDAIGKCLVPYNYYVHPVYLTVDELDNWIDLTVKLKKMGWVKSAASKDNKNGSMAIEMQKLLNRRRNILEQATTKITSLKDILHSLGPNNIAHTLIYASDKGRQQLDNIHTLLNDLKITYHQITKEETGKGTLATELIKDFVMGNIQILTAMRVLDEGVDIPEVTTAFILASTTVERQWIQRRGRVLRKCARTGKQMSFIHDFLVLPPIDKDSDLYTEDIGKMVKYELERIMEFASLSKNAAAPDGALTAIRPVIDSFM